MATFTTRAPGRLEALKRGSRRGNTSDLWGSEQPRPSWRRRVTRASIDRQLANNDGGVTLSE